MNDDNDIRRGLEQEAQIIAERIPMSESQQDHVVLQILEYLKYDNVSQAAFAKAINVGQTKLNQILNGKYKGNSEDVLNKAVNYLNSIERKKRREADRPGYVETTVALAIRDLIINTEMFSEDEGKIGVIVGDGGHGKSICLKQFAKANQNSVYVELDDCMHSSSIFAAIAAELKIDSSGSMTKIKDRLIENLRHRHVIVMLDEASGLTVKKLNQLRQIIVVKCRCPLILAGNHGLWRTLSMSTDGGKESLDQFTSRLMAIVDLDERAGKPKGDGGLYSAEDIRKMFEFGGIKLTKVANMTLRKICMSPRSGRLRTCKQIIIALHTAKAIVDCGLIDHDDILACIKALKLPVRNWLPLLDKKTIQEDEQQQQAAAAG